MLASLALVRLRGHILFAQQANKCIWTDGQHIMHGVPDFRALGMLVSEQVSNSHIILFTDGCIIYKQTQ